ADMRDMQRATADLAYGAEIAAGHLGRLWWPVTRKSHAVEYRVVNPRVADNTDEAVNLVDEGTITPRVQDLWHIRSEEQLQPVEVVFTCQFPIEQCYADSARCKGASHIQRHVGLQRAAVSENNGWMSPRHGKSMNLDEDLFTVWLFQQTEVY